MQPPTIIVYAPGRRRDRRGGANRRVRNVVADLTRVAGRELRLTQAQIADAADCTRETASLELARLARAGVIEQKRGRIIVLRPDALDTDDES
jgi:CRP-like cAMP-binding protein